MNILIPGGCGYLGARLIPFLLADGHKVTVVDTQWFGHGFLPGDNENLTMVKADVREVPDFDDMDAVIWLASISNNDMYAVNRELTHAVNTFVRRGTAPKFLYASSVAVLDPTSDYAKDKLNCEAQLKDTGAIIVRSASVCGYSVHQRFDLTLNKMAHDAYRKGVITVNGGDQIRAHIHIDDLCDFYRVALKNAVAGETYTPSTLDESVGQSAKNVVYVFNQEGRSVDIETKPRADNRSYGKYINTLPGWTPKLQVWNGVRDLLIKFNAGYWSDSLTNPVYMNINHAI